MRYSQHMSESEAEVPPTRKTPYVSMNLTVEARDRLQRLTLNLAAEAGRRLSMSAVLLAALDVAERDRAALRESLAADDEAPDPDGPR